MTQPGWSRAGQGSHDFSAQPTRAVSGFWGPCCALIHQRAICAHGHVKEALGSSILRDPGGLLMFMLPTLTALETTTV